MSREGEIPTGMEEQDIIAASVYDESSSTRSYDICCLVSKVSSLISDPPFLSEGPLRFGHLFSSLKLALIIDFLPSFSSDLYCKFTSKYAAPAGNFELWI